MSILRHIRLALGRLRPGGAVRAAAGLPAAISTPSRRGTVLVIVLGTLALISVIAVVYVVVGRADRQAAAAFVGSVKREEMPALIRDYIADIVGRDALATYRDGAGDLKREAFDYPFTDPYLRSVVVGASGAPGDQPVAANEREARRFNPEGTFASPSLFAGTLAGVRARGSLGNTLELRMPSDPWLAATQPTNLRIDDDVPDNGYPQFNIRDWAHITNIAPDGRFVNLWNLRNNFRARSGFSVADRDISSRLTLYGPTGLPFTATGPQTLDSGQAANANAPAHWASRQRGAFRPVTGLPNIGWSQAEFAAYQWADADGDGFVDSRWIELVDISNGLELPRDLFPSDSGFRWFVAARIIDLSAAVNVNTATDFLARPAAPGANYAAPGGTPADVDLRRLLTGEDLYELAGGIGYDAIRPPVIPGTSNIDAASAQYTGLVDAEMAAQVGDAAYNTARYFLEYGLIPPSTPAAAAVRLSPPNYTAFRNYVSSQHGVTLQQDALFRFQQVRDRKEWYDLSAGVATGGDLSVSIFTVDSEAELLTYRSANDPRFTSTLELVLDGRHDGGGGLNPNPTDSTFRYGPMRSTRTAAVEVADRDRSPGLLAPGALGPVNPDGFADLDAMTQVLTDVRQHITTVSAARPLRNTPINTASPVPALGAGDVPAQTSSISSNTQSLFSIYADALLPYSGILETWLPAGNAAGRSFRTLSYGHAGSELALRHAAHMAVNMAEAASPGQAPRVATVLVDENRRNTLNSDYDPPPPPGQNPTGTVFVKPMGAGGAGRSHPWAAWVDGGRLDLGASRLADSSNGATPTNPAFNVYGVGPQPFISEVSAIVLYTDAPPSAGGDNEGNGNPITIRGTQDSGNSDMAFQAVAFQITNPFDVSIELSGDTAQRESRYYIEFGGRFYRIPNVDANEPGWTGSLGPRQTRVFYTTARPRGDIESRWDALSSGAGSRVGQFINSLMGVGGVAPVQLAEFDPATGLSVAFGAGGAEPGAFRNRFQATPGGTIAEVRLWRTYLATGTTSSAEPAETYTQNARQNDILADRFRDPAATGAGETQNTLAPILSLPSNQVARAFVVEPGPNETGTNYDTGVSILLWSSVRRPSDPETVTKMNANTPNQIVWLPAYCLEPKFRTTFNQAVEDGLPRSSFSAEDIDSSSRSEISMHFSELLNQVIGPESIVASLGADPRTKNHDDIPSNLQGESWSNLLTEFRQRIGGSNARPLLPTDLLIPMGIGPSLDVPASMVPTLSGWTTLGEAMLLALDYDQGTPGIDVMWRPGRPHAGPTALDRGSLDRGHLLIDQFVPFYDENPNGQAFDPAVDTVYGDGQPLALGIVAATRGLGNNYGGFRRATQGLININTAPLAVLRTLPMLSPTHAADPRFPGSVAGSAWWGAPTGQGVTSDVATTVLAYRDLLDLIPRGDPLGNFPLPPNDVVNFTPGRGVTAGIDGVREVPGFRSVAEVLNARVLGGRLATNTAGLHDIDRLGFNGLPVNMAGFDPVVYTGLGVEGVDPLADEFDERLVIASTLLNSVSVRSDTYAAWFILHGYRESDCTGLATDDPLVPSVARRFLMILDRSNVVAPGDKPRILLFREVPYTALGADDRGAV